MVSQRVITITSGYDSPPISPLLVSEFTKPDLVVHVDWNKEHIFEVKFNRGSDEIKHSNFSSCAIVCRYLARLAIDRNLYGTSPLQLSEVDSWLTFAQHLETKGIQEFGQALTQLNAALATTCYLVGHGITIADLVLWGSIYSHRFWKEEVAPDNVFRWFQHLKALKEFQSVINNLPVEVKKTAKIISAPEASSKISTVNMPKEEGKFVELPGAEKGKVVVRFPPEASGYLHIGHAKAALLNQHYQLAFEGKLIMRFDDTNPAKEKEDFEKVILEDVKMLQIKPDLFTYTSDHFDLILQKCQELIRKGKGYVDDTDAEVMKAEREQRKESSNRNSSVEKNLGMWEEMKKGTDYGQKCCVRAKIDMNSDNGCMRDPTIYRCKNETHPRTGNKYHVYPTYDFACPIVDSIEGVTHSLRTTEYHDRDPQFYWFIDALGLRKPFIYEYSRLNMMNTVLSKRKLTWFVEQGIVNGWDDPRMPTVRGVLRKGMTVEGLKQFIIAQGSSKSVAVMDWDKIWAFNKKVIDPIAPRYNAVEKENAVIVRVSGVTEEALKVQKHPKNLDVGTKTVWVGPELVIDSTDAQSLKEGESVTFINWGNLTIKTLNKNASGKVESVDAVANLDNKDFKKTLKITWLAKNNKASFVPCVCIYYDHIISKPVLDKDEDFRNHIAENTIASVEMIGDPELSSLKKSDIIQIQRKGFFICDQPYDGSTLRHTGKESPLILIAIPDGSQDTTSLPRSVLNLRLGTEKEKAQSAKGKAFEKSPQVESITLQDSVQGDDLNNQINEQGAKIRNLKAQRATKDIIDKEVKILLELKGKFKSATGNDWKPNQNAPASQVKKVPATTTTKQVPLAKDSVEINKRIIEQGNKIRDLKGAKVVKTILDPEIKTLLALKQEYKAVTGTDWKPQDTASPKEVARDSDEVTNLNQEIVDQGNKIRDLKSSKASKDVLDPEIKKLLTLKQDFKALTNTDWKPQALENQPKQQPKKESSPTKNVKPPGVEKKNNSNTQKESEAASNVGAKKITRLGMEATKEDNLADWYSQVITKAELIEYYDISGCYILRPWAYSIWESIKELFDSRIKSIGVQNCYFPMFVSQHALEREKTHIADFAPEVAWVTRSGETELAEPIAIRPTSETVMYPTYAKWIKSHRDLPLQLNQWCNVVRWEFKHPQPFLRTREFLWQEGHTAYATQEEAVNEVYIILEYYAEIYEKLLAIPVIRGKKTEKEKFAGGDFTTTVEAFISASGRAIQGGTSHHLGQNFSKMFEVVFEDPETNEKKYVYQNSWGLTTRTIGVMVMVHGDNTGLILPPRVACYQVVIVPCGITVNTTKADKDNLIESCKKFEETLTTQGIRCKGDYRDNYSPGWKYNHWELKGVPIRVELGPRDIKSEQFVAVRRDTAEKITIRNSEAAAKVKQLLDIIQDNLYQKADQDMQSHLKVVDNFDDFCSRLDEKCVIQAPFCGEIPCEDLIKKDSAKGVDQQQEAGAPSMGAKSLCIPFKQPADLKPGMKCVHPDCGKAAKYYTLFGRSY